MHQDRMKRIVSNLSTAVIWSAKDLMWTSDVEATEIIIIYLWPFSQTTTGVGGEAEPYLIIGRPTRSLLPAVADTVTLVVVHQLPILGLQQSPRNVTLRWDETKQRTPRDRILYVHHKEALRSCVMLLTCLVNSRGFRQKKCRRAAAKIPVSPPHTVDTVSSPE